MLIIVLALTSTSPQITGSDFELELILTLEVVPCSSTTTSPSTNF